MDPRGYYPKFAVTRRDTGEEVTDDTFTLMPAHDPHAVVALAAYAVSCEGDNPALAGDLRDLLREHGHHYSGHVIKFPYTTVSVDVLPWEDGE